MDTPSPLPPAAGQTSVIARLRHALTRADGFAQQPALRRALPAIGVLFLTMAGLAIWLLVAPADRAQVQPGLPPAEKGRALEALSTAGFDAQLDPASGALTVPAADYHRARMTLAGEGMPLAGGGLGPDGMSALENMPMGTSRQVEAARLRRMQELDLARTIAELRPVRAARVHLALPERTAFVRDLDPPRASVVLDLAPGMSLNAAQVRAVVSMVAAAVPDMPRGQVSVVDQTGALLTAEESDPLQAETDRQLAHQRRMERLYRERVMALLTPMVGAGNAAVEITLDMDFTRSEITSEEFSPDTALRSEQSTQQVGGGDVTSGIPGAVSNLPPQEAQLNATAEGAEADAQTDPKAGITRHARQSSFATTRNYEVSRRVETRQPQMAQVTQVFAAVLIHELPATEADAELGETDSATEMIAKVDALTRSAIGFDEARGDLVTVTTAPFVAATPLVAAPAWHEAAWLPTVGRTLAQLLIMAIIVLGIIRPLLQRILPPPDGQMALDGAFPGAVEVHRGESFSALRNRLQTDTPTLQDLDGSLSYEEKIDLVRQLADGDSKRVAGVFKDMLKAGGS
ncbi:MAG: flagellar M-ring protein FliF [Rhodobacteraceae bacterium]|nr:flagellar M-ring protein FliF [Paracoccaceae bacterium]